MMITDDNFMDHNAGYPLEIYHTHLNNRAAQKGVIIK